MNPDVQKQVARSIILEELMSNEGVSPEDAALIYDGFLLEYGDMLPESAEMRVSMFWKWRKAPTFMKKHITRVSVERGRRMSNGSFVSFRIEANFEPAQQAGVSLEEVTRYLGDELNALLDAEQVSTGQNVQNATAAMSGAGGQNPVALVTTETVDMESVSCNVQNGKKVVRIHGGRWTKFGVAVYPEVTRGTILENLPIGSMPISGKAVIELSDGKPRRVLAFKSGDFHS